jgi:hypothetical protein
VIDTRRQSCSSCGEPQSWCGLLTNLDLFFGVASCGWSHVTALAC